MGLSWMASRPTSPSQIDLHIHAGQERESSLEELIHWLVANRVTFLGLLDHSELYQLGEVGLRAKLGRLVYRSSREGLESFFSSIEEARRLHSQEAFIFKGLELPEWDLPYIQPTFVASADFLGAHLNTSCTDPHFRHYTSLSWGEHVAERAAQLAQLAAGRPAVLFHPFHRRLREIQALLDGLESEQPEDDSLLILDDGDLRVLEERVDKELVFFELNFSDIFLAASHDLLFEALRSAVALLRDAGFAFSLGSDLHSIPEKRVDPTGVLTSLGIGIRHLRIVEALL